AVSVLRHHRDAALLRHSNPQGGVRRRVPCRDDSRRHRGAAGRSALTTLGWSQAVRDSAQRWSPDMIHDSVAAIARQPAYSASVRQSLLGRFFRFLFDRLRDLQAALGRSSGVKLTVIVAIALIVFVIVARIVMARRIEDDRAGRYGRGAG